MNLRELVENPRCNFTIAIEGPDCVGKETQSEILLERLLTTTKYLTWSFEMPFHDKLTYSKIYEMLNDGTAKKYPHIFQGLQITNRLLCQSTVIKDFLAQFDILLFDRWNASSYAYGRAAGLTAEELMTILPLVADTDLTIILDGPAFHKAKLDDYERDAELQKNVRNYYREWAEMQTSQRVVILDASASIEDISAEIWSIVSGHIPQLNDNVVNLSQYRKKEK